MMCNPQKFKDLPLSVWDLFGPFLVNLQACEFSSPQGENTRSVRPLYRNFSESPSTRVILWRLLSPIDSSVNSSVKKKTWCMVVMNKNTECQMHPYFWMPDTHKTWRKESLTCKADQANNEDDSKYVYIYISIYVYMYRHVLLDKKRKDIYAKKIFKKKTKTKIQVCSQKKQNWIHNSTVRCHGSHNDWVMSIRLSPLEFR